MLAHMTSDDEYRVYFQQHGLLASASEASFALGASEALVDPWIPPAALDAKVSDITSNPHSICAATVHVNAAGLYAAVLGFTTVARTQYRIYILQAPANPAVSGSSTGKPVILGQSSAKDLPNVYETAETYEGTDFRALVYAGNPVTGTSRVYSMWHKDGG